MTDEPTDDDAREFEALNAYVEQGVQGDDSLNPLFACLDRLGQLGRDETGYAPLPDSTLRGVPEQLGDYRVGETLGRGGMGTVYRAAHVTMGHAVAIKVIPADSASTDVVERFYQEARAAAGEEHPGVVAVRHVGRQDYLHYLVMDLVDGPTLAERLLDGPLGWEAALKLAARVADALAHLHERGVIHRDLKPSNILLDKHGRPYVTDFGLAKLTGAVVRTHSRALVGTPRYMAPEQAAGKARDVGPESDLFSLGSVLYECLTGRPAFDADHPLDAVLQVIETDPPAVRTLVADVSKNVQRVLDRCLAKDRADRYDNAAELTADLNACLAGEPLARHRSRLRTMTTRAFRRRPAVVLHLFGIGAIALLTQSAHLLGVQSRAERLGETEHFANHTGVMSVLGGWFVASMLLQTLWRTNRLDRAVPFAWAVVDAVFLTWVLIIVDWPLEAPSVGYSCLIAVAGVWLRPVVVWVTWAFSIVGYLLLHIWHEPQFAHFPLIFLAGLTLVAGATAHQVQRVRWLSAVAESETHMR